VNGKFGTYHAAHIATNALITVGHADNVVALAVGLVGLVKQVLRAKLNAETASLAPFCVDNDPVLVGFGHAFAQGSPVLAGVCWKVWI
jgi:hypothetical protein